MLRFESGNKVFDAFINGTLLFAGGTVVVAGVTGTVLIANDVINHFSTAPCDIDGDHAHLYMDPETHIERYIDSEREYKNGLIRLEDYREITQDEKELLKFENSHDLFRISENTEQLQEIEQSNNEHPKEYRYKYTETVHWSTPMKVGKGWTVIQHSKEVTRYSWTTDTSKELTGEERDVEYVYSGYKVVKGDNGKYELIKSDPVGSISQLPEGFDYVSRDLYMKVDPITKEALTYEDGSTVDGEIDYDIQESVEDNLSAVVKDSGSAVIFSGIVGSLLGDTGIFKLTAANGDEIYLNSGNSEVINGENHTQLALDTAVSYIDNDSNIINYSDIASADFETSEVSTSAVINNGNGFTVIDINQEHTPEIVNDSWVFVTKDGSQIEVEKENAIIIKGVAANAKAQIISTTLAKTSSNDNVMSI